MIEVHCPFCERIHTKEQYKEEREGSGMSITCNACYKTFYVYRSKLDLPTDRVKRAASIVLSEELDTTMPHFTIVENIFAYEQKYALPEKGEIVVGRKNKDSNADLQIYTSDPSMDRLHFVLGKTGRGEKAYYYVRDNESRTGTFVNNALLQKGEKYRLKDGDVLSVGASSIIISLGENEDEEAWDLSDFDIE